MVEEDLVEVDAHEEDIQHFLAFHAATAAVLMVAEDTRRRWTFPCCCC